MKLFGKLSNLSGNARGSMLIASLWTLSVFSVFVSNLGFQAAQQAVLLKRENDSFESRADFLSALHWLGQKIQQDEEPGEDTVLDAWYGEIVLPEPWNERLVLNVEDEYARLDINRASQAALENLFKLAAESGLELEGDAEDFAVEILKLRGTGEIRSLEELYLAEDIKSADVEKLRPYLTVYTSSSAVNINTAEPLVIEALVRSVAADDFARENLLRRLGEFRKEGENGTGEPGVFYSLDLTPDFFLTRLRLTPSVQMVQLAHQLMPLLTTDSLAWHLHFKSANGREAMAVIRAGEYSEKFRVVSWREF